MIIRHQMSEETVKTGWSALLNPAWLPAVAVLVGGVLLHSMNVLMLATVLPSVVDDFCAAALIFGTGALICALAPSMGQVVAGRFVQGFGGGLLTAIAYVLVRNTF